jgi:hypothetical protein
VERKEKTPPPRARFLPRVHIRVVPGCSPPSVVPDYVGFLRTRLGRTATRLTTAASFEGRLGGTGNTCNSNSTRRDADAAEADAEAEAEHQDASRAELRAQSGRAAGGAGAGARGRVGAERGAGLSGAGAAVMPLFPGIDVWPRRGH